MKLHVVALPHTQLNDEYLSCAYTQKIAKFMKMMGERWDITLYANDSTDPVVASFASEVVPVLSEAERAGWFGEGFDTALTPLKWDASEPYWKLANQRIIQELRERQEQGDLLLLSTGWPQLPLVQQAPLLKAVEPFVGYEGVCTKHVVWESYSWMHHVYGINQWRNGRVYDDVIPNYFEREDFITHSRKSSRGSGNYLLYLGRVVERKGVHIAAQIAARADMPLVVAGPGGHWDNRWLKTTEGLEIGDREAITYLGEVGKEDRAKLLHEAHALLAPTVYVEPFGGVAAEAMMAGTPVVASDWGAFVETVTPEVGLRFRTLQEGADAVKAVGALDRRAIQAYAQRTYSLEAVGPRFDTYFNRLGELWGEGWYAR